MVNIIGISALYHDSACCLLKDGTLVAAASEERFTRVKFDPRMPISAFRYCLREAGLDIHEIDVLAYYEKPQIKWERQIWAETKPSGATNNPRQREPPAADKPEFLIRHNLGYEGPILYFDHHRSHAASSYFYSGFEQAAVLTVDGVGEWATTTYGRGSGDLLELFEEVRFPHSLGLFYATLTAYLGFRVNDGEYKVMGLAPYGKPRFTASLRHLIQAGPGGGFTLDMTYFDFLRGERMFSEELARLLGAPSRQPGSELTAFHYDLARSLQVVVEEVLLQKVTYLHERVAAENLCMAGGVALNCVANGRILREGPFKRLFIQPAAGDAGSALGAAALAHIQLTGKRPRREPLRQVFLGPSFGADEIGNLLAQTDIRPLDFRADTTGLLQAVAERLAQCKVVGWFQGRMEFGPRALGARSILANPLDPGIRDRLNHMVKKRESFRPFAPSVLANRAAEHFQLLGESPFMLLTCQVTSALILPGITHVDGSARPQTVDPAQNPRYAALLAVFHQLTGCPILVNTSFNTAGEPIVCSPLDALLCMTEAGLDTLVLEDFIIDRQMIPPGWQDWLPYWRRRQTSPFATSRSPISETLYTFV